MDNIPHNVRFKKLFKKFKNLLINLNLDLMDIDEYMKQKDNDCHIDNLHYYILALEDNRFFKHFGVDLYAVLRELIKFILRKKYGGASTIDMQLVRTLTGYRDKTVSRKLYEILLAILINFKYTKKQIINCYMREAYLGSGIKGFKAAIQKRFPSKTIYDLNTDELSSLAAMLLKPMPLKPTKKWYTDIYSRALYVQKRRIFVKESKN